ncbi:hypothetical protein LCGC14_0894750 [marine sediment metagenome]|uniref:Uncharacterized protein n=1 Tax=marine sediment metagenome TaxID=412755 RepID=A0A0F9NY82_9ZZZZ
MFNIDFKDIIFQLTPHFLRKDNLLRFMFSGIKPLKTINNDGVVVESFGQKNSSLHQFILFIANFLNFDARTIYLERFLNDIYDPVTEGIVIVNDNTIRVLYLFNKAEEREDVFFYNNWDSTIAYIVDDFAVGTDNKVYQANTNNTNDEPPSGNWDFVKDITFVFNFQDEFPFDYRVEIPLGITLQPDYSNERIKSQIRLFNAAGRSFEGVEKGNITNQFFNSLT